jgi:hypothetical protein
MNYSFRPAVRSNVNLLIGLAGASGAGKTYTAMRLASGMSQGKRFAVIDTENGRASHYADQFAFDVAELHEPFTPHAYAEAINAADAAGYSVIVVDSMSHEYAGHGGILDMQEAEYQRMGGRDSAKMASWIRPKMEHKKMMQRLLQTRAHLILCFRAEAKIDIIKEDGKTKIVPKQSLVGIDGWIPLTEKTVPFELTVSLLLTPDHPGIPKPIKLQEQHRTLFPLDSPITEDSGRRIAEWAAGGAASRAPGAGSSASTGQPSVPAGDSTPGDAVYITPDQIAYLETLCLDNKIELARLKIKAGVNALAQIRVQDYDRAKAWIDKAIEAKTTA